MRAKQDATLGRTIHANRVPLGALAALFAMSLAAACSVGDAHLVGPSAPGDSSSTPTSTPPASTSATVNTIVVNAPSSSLALLQTLQAQATAYDTSGKTLQGFDFTWSSSNTLVATVSNTGLITAQLPGTTRITAVSGSVSSPAVMFTVTP